MSTDTTTMPHKLTEASAPDAATGSSAKTTADDAASQQLDGAHGGVVAAAAGTPTGLATQGLRLARLHLNGFKSFADKTTFTIDQPITGIVGPNGCGKSNVVDAIKWVLGERSSKSLRGKEMIDVIFAGSAARKPAGMASVSLVFENPIREDADIDALVAKETGDKPDDEAATDLESLSADADASTDTADDASESPARSDTAVADEPTESLLADRRRVRRPLPVDSDEVAVERQLYRDGTSKYLINGKRARLKDIRDLFLDTGIGADAYSIIEQGKVDAMLLASPQERRTIFEEAAGIAKFKQRRIESQRKLDRAESNLVLTREQLENTERRLRIVKGQAAKARRFKELDDEYGALRLAVAFDQYHEICSRLDSMTSQLQKLEAERDETQHAHAANEEAMQAIEVRCSEAASALRTTENAIRDATHTIEQARQRRQMAERAIDEARRQVELDNKRLESVESQIEALNSDIADQRETVAALAERVAEADRTLDEATTSRAATMEQIATARHSHEQARSRLVGMEREQQQLTNEADSIGQRIEDLSAEETKLATRIESIEHERAEIESKLETITGEIESRNTTIASLEAERESLSSKGETLAGARKDQGATVEKLSEERIGLDARRATLEEMVTSRAGLAEAAKKVMEIAESGEGFGGVIAPLADLVETDTEHAAAVEAALGQDLQAIVTRSIAENPTDDEIDALPGRVRFIPLTGLPSAASFAGSESTPLGLASLPASRLVAVRELVKAKTNDTPTAELLDRLLDETYLVENLDVALMLTAGPLASRPGVRFVTRRGEVLDHLGRTDVGPAGSEQGVGLIRHHAELAELETTLVSVTQRLDTERSELERLDASAASVQEERNRVSGELAEHRRSLAGEQAKEDRLKGDIDRLERDAGSVRTEITRAESRHQELASTRADKLSRVESLEGLIGEQRGSVETLASTLAGLQTRAEAASEQMSAAREDAGRANAQLDGARREVSRLERAVDEAAQSKAEHERHADQARQRLSSHEQTIEQTATDLAEAEAMLADAKSGLDEKQQAVSESTAERTGLAETLNASRERARLVERDWHGVEASRRELEVKRESLEERTSEDLRIDLGAEYLEYRAVMAPGDVERVDIADSQARINVLRGEIKKLGNVNLDSIAEEGQLTEADEGLRSQIADLDEARVKLTDLIERLNTASRERFGEVFDLIRENFGGQDGMFRRLFGGGRAEVRLMGLVKEVEDVDGTVRKVVTDETDLLESGVEVIAKPPGKEPRSISQLSGGEKTLTAVALLMAIFRSKPSCFCVLDEVDAALDEANVGRFCNTVRAFTDMSSFIVITHNKRTMQLADHLYGVTQQERGVSKRVSVRFDHVSSDGSFDVKKASVDEPEDSASAAKTPTAGGTSAEQKPAEKPRASGGLRKALAKMRDADNPKSKSEM